MQMEDYWSSHDCNDNEEFEALKKEIVRCIIDYYQHAFLLFNESLMQTETQTHVETVMASKTKQWQDEKIKLMEVEYQPNSP